MKGFVADNCREMELMTQKSLSDSMYSRSKKVQQWQGCIVFFTYMYYHVLWNLKFCSADVELQERLLSYRVYCNKLP